jgi:putative transposase
VPYYKNHRRNDSIIRKRMREIADIRIRYGYWRIYTLLRREGWKDNHKRVYRVYCEEGLNLRSKRPRRNRAASHRLERLQLSSTHQSWSGRRAVWNLWRINYLTAVKSGP